MAECHPVGFQWVMEAKARGAKLIHVDPRFTRTSAVADLHVPIRAGADIAFLGGLINYVLQQRESTSATMCVAYTNAPTIIDRGLRGHRGSGRSVLRPGPEHRVYDSETWRYQGDEEIAAGQRPARRGAVRCGRCAGRRAVRRTARAGRRPIPSRTPTRRCSIRAACSRCSNGTSPGTRRRWWRRSAACRAELFAQVCRLITENSGRDRTTAFVYSRRLDPAHGGRAVHPHRGDPAVAARQHRPAGRRHPGAARARLHPGLDRHPHAVRPAARLPADAARAYATTTSTAYVRGRAHRQGLLGEHPQLHGQPAEGLVGRRRDGGQRLLLRLPATADRQPQHVRDGPGPDGRGLQGLLPVRRRIPLSARPTAACSGSAWRTWTGWWSGTWC